MILSRLNYLGIIMFLFKVTLETIFLGVTLFYILKLSHNLITFELQNFSV
jgi:hypothetical protein